MFRISGNGRTGYKYTKLLTLRLLLHAMVIHRLAVRGSNSIDRREQRQKRP